MVSGSSHKYLQVCGHRHRHHLCMRKLKPSHDKVGRSNYLIYYLKPFFPAYISDACNIYTEFSNRASAHILGI